MGSGIGWDHNPVHSCLTTSRAFFFRSELSKVGCHDDVDVVKAPEIEQL